MKLGCVLLSAGTGNRFGSNKLLTEISGKALIEYILSNLPIDHFDEIVAVVSNDTVKKIVKGNNIKTVHNHNPEYGISMSIRLGIQALEDVDACMFCVSDQPLLSSDTIIDMIKNYKQGSIYSLSHNGKRGNPVIFPASLLNELSNLKKGEFGTKVIYDHEDLLVLHDTPNKEELFDIDTHENLDSIKSLISEKIN